MWSPDLELEKHCDDYHYIQLTFIRFTPIFPLSDERQFVI